jgi:hypothetical protein
MLDVQRLTPRLALSNRALAISWAISMRRTFSKLIDYTCLIGQGVHGGSEQRHFRSNVHVTSWSCDLIKTYTKDKSRNYNKKILRLDIQEGIQLQNQSFRIKVKQTYIETYLKIPESWVKSYLPSGHKNCARVSLFSCSQAWSYALIGSPATYVPCFERFLRCLRYRGSDPRDEMSLLASALRSKVYTVSNRCNQLVTLSALHWGTWDW